MTARRVLCGARFSWVPVPIAEGTMLEIAAHAFANCGKLDGVVLPDALVTLGDAVFENCLSLTAIDVLAGVGSVGNAAFRGCAAEIGENAFEGGASLTRVVLPDVLATLGTRRLKIERC